MTIALSSLCNTSCGHLDTHILTHTRNITNNHEMVFLHQRFPFFTPPQINSCGNQFESFVCSVDPVSCLWLAAPHTRATYPNPPLAIQLSIRPMGSVQPLSLPSLCSALNLSKTAMWHCSCCRTKRIRPLVLSRIHRHTFAETPQHETMDKTSSGPSGSVGLSI